MLAPPNLSAIENPQFSIAKKSTLIIQTLNMVKKRLLRKNILVAPGKYKSEKLPKFLVRKRY
jgi:hypothetical protein